MLLSVSHQDSLQFANISSEITHFQP